MDYVFGITQKRIMSCLKSDFIIKIILFFRNISLANKSLGESCWKFFSRDCRETFEPLLQIFFSNSRGNTINKKKLSDAEWHVTKHVAGGNESI